MKYKIGDRVYHNHLKDGTVKKIFGNTFLLVIFDKKPFVQYNMETKGCLVFEQHLRTIEQENETKN